MPKSKQQTTQKNYHLAHGIRAITICMDALHMIDISNISTINELATIILPVLKVIIATLKISEIILDIRKKLKKNKTS